MADLPGSLVRTGPRAGAIGHQRGVAQSGFAGERRDTLQDDPHHVQRLLAMRGVISAGRQRLRQREAMLDAVGYPLICVSPQGRMVYANAAAEALIEEAHAVKLVHGVLTAVSPAADRELKAAMLLASKPGQPSASAVSVPVAGGKRCDLSLVPTSGPDGPRSVLITISSSGALDGSVARRLRALHGLTEAEAQIALSLAEGKSPAEIATARSSSVGTVRVQIKSVAAKLNLRRQAEIVAVVKSLPPAPKQL